MQFFLLLLTLSHFAVAEDEKFAFTFSGNGCSKNTQDVCLLQEQPIGADVTLLEVNSNQVCYGKIISHFTYKDEVLTFKASRVKSDLCKLPAKNYFLGVLNKKLKKYEVIIPKNLSEKESETLGKEILHSEKFSKYLLETETIKSYIKGKKIHYTIKDFPNVRSLARHYEDKNLNATVVSHKLFPESENPPGAMFLVLNKEAFPISDICISDQEKLMKIEESYYFYTKSQGCDTDYVFDEIFKVKDNKVDLVLRDGSWSL